MSIAPTVVGFFGDATTLVGGIWLAWDAAQKDMEVRKIEKLAERYREPRMARLKITMDGVEIEHEPGTDPKESLERVFIQRSARKAKWGCLILAIGFAILTLSRIWELAGG